jgi:hypothetical protein
MKYVLPTLVKMAIVMALVACAGQSSDPKKEYKDLKAVPASQSNDPDSPYVPDAQSVMIDGANTTTFGNFIEGKQGELKIRILPHIENLEKPTFIFSDFPSADEPQVVQIEPNLYKLVWTPKAGTIAPGKTSASFSFVVTVMANGQHDEIKPVFIVNKNNFSPKINGVDGLENAKIEEGKFITFSVDVKDQNSNNSEAPRLLVLPSRNANTEAFAESAAFFVTDNHAIDLNPKAMPDGTFRFYKVMKINSLPDLLDRKGKVDPNAASIPLCIDFEAITSGVSSGTVQKCVTGVYSAQPPVFTFAKADRKVVAGQSNVIDFSVGTANSLSAVSIQALSVKDSKGIVRNLSIDKALHCDAADKKTSLNCTVTWAPSCTAKDESSILQIKSVSNLNQKSKNSTTEEQFEIDHSACEAQAIAKIEADKKAADERAAAELKAADERAAAELKAKEEKAAAAQAAAEKKAADAKALADKKAAKAAAQKEKPKTASTAEQKS